MSEDLSNELSAINSIYGDRTIHVSGSNTAPSSIYVLSIPKHDVSLQLRFPAGYPDSPPEICGIEGVGLIAKKGYGQHVSALAKSVLRDVYVPGAVCLFDLLDMLECRLQEEGRALIAGGQASKDRPDGSEALVPDHKSDLDATYPMASADHSSVQQDENKIPADIASPPSPTPRWILSDPVTVKKSVFLARAASIRSSAHVGAYMSSLFDTDKNTTKATHNIFAYRIVRSGAPSSTVCTKSTRRLKNGADGPTSGQAEKRSDIKERVDEDFDDDGESAAGGRLLKQLQLMNVTGVLVVVSRWYGGVKLGPARFGIICGIGKEAVVRMSQEEEKG